MIDLDAIRKRLAETAGSTPGPWRLAKRHTMSAPHVAIVADGDTGWDDPVNIGGYGGHLVAESVHKTNRALLLAAPQLRKDAAAMADEIEALRARNAVTDALSVIATLTGCPEWEYPGQVVRDVEAVIRERDEAQERAMNLAALLVRLRDNYRGGYFLDTDTGRPLHRDHACAECVGADDIPANCVGFQCAYHKLIATVGPFNPQEQV